MQEQERDRVAQAYASEPWWYDVRGYFILLLAYNSSLGRQLRLFAPNFRAHHLDVACGSGTLLEMMLNWRRKRGLPEVEVVGIDYAERMLAGARRRFAGRVGTRFLHADVAAMPFDDASFDSVSVANAVHSFPDVDGGLRDIHRVLRPGGILTANVLLHPRTPWPLSAIARRINAWGMAKGILHTPYALEDIRQRIVAAGFRIEREAVAGNCFDFVASRPG